jgi:hypothetical protein
LLDTCCCRCTILVVDVLNRIRLRLSFGFGSAFGVRPFLFSNSLSFSISFPPFRRAIAFYQALQCQDVSFSTKSKPSEAHRQEKHTTDLRADVD